MASKRQTRSQANKAATAAAESETSSSLSDLTDSDQDAALSAANTDSVDQSKGDAQSEIQSQSEADMAPQKSKDSKKSRITLKVTQQAGRKTKRKRKSGLSKELVSDSELSDPKLSDPKLSDPKLYDPKLSDPLSSSEAPRDSETPTKKRNKRSSDVAKTARTPTKGVTSAKDMPCTIAGTFSDFHMNEPKLAAYLGFTNKGDFRRFRFSYLVIQPFMIWKLFRVGSIYKDAQQYLEEKGEYNHDEVLLWEQLLSKWDQIRLITVKTQKRVQEAELLGELLLYVYKSMQDIDFASKDTSTKQVEHVKWLEGNSNVVIPAFDLSDIQQLPSLGPHHGETFLEPINRIYNLLSSLGFVLAPSRFNGSFGSKVASPYALEIIGTEHLPLWMNVADEEDQSDQQQQSITMFPAIKFILIWNKERKTRYTTDLLQHIKDHIEPELLKMPGESVSKTDPRQYHNGAQWRDDIRRELLFEKLRVDFASMDVTTGGFEDNILSEGSGSPWTTIVDRLRKAQAGDDITFIYTLKPIDLDEEYPFEFDGPPLALQDSIQFTSSGDVAWIPHTSIGQPQVDQEIETTGTLDPGTIKIKSQDEIRKDRQREQRAMLSTGSTRRSMYDEPVNIYKRSPDTFLEYYSGIDTRTVSQLRAWQRQTIDAIIPPQPRPKPALKVLKTATPQQRQAVEQIEKLQEESAMAADIGEIEDTSTYFKIQGAFTGNQLQIGPPVDPCKRLLGFVTTAKHGMLQELDKSKTTFINCDFEFLDSQINCAAFMLQHTLGIVPSVQPSNAYPLEKLQKDAIDVLGPRTFGGLVCDTMGLGKTLATILFMNVFANYLYTDTEVEHRPILLLVPSGVVLEQWRSEIAEKFPDLTVIVAYGDKPEGSMKSKRNWIGPKEMRVGPGSKSYSQDLSYIWDIEDPKASRAILLTSYDTWQARTLRSSLVKSRSSDGQLVEEIHYHSAYKGAFALVIMDEGHRLRNRETKAHIAVRELECEYHWFITATPSINNLSDIAGLLSLLWPRIETEFYSKEGTNAFLMDLLQGGTRKFSEVGELLDGDIRKLALLHPDLVLGITRSDDLNEIRNNFHYIDNLVSIRRSTASVLDRGDGAGGKISLQSIMPTHEVKTVEVDYAEDEKPEMQWTHRASAQIWSKIVKNWLRSRDKEDKGKRNSFPPVTGIFRQLAIGTAATRLSRLDSAMRKIRLSTNVDGMTRYNSPEYEAEWLIKRVIRPGDVQPVTRQDQLRFLTTGSPVLRFVLSQLRDYVLPYLDTSGDPKKLMVTLDTPLVAWYYERVLNLLHINTKVLGAFLTADERTKVVAEFNDPKGKLVVIIVMYSVSSQGANMDGCCNRVCVCEPAINHASEVQAWTRAVRVSQRYRVLIYRVRNKNSNDQWKDSRTKIKIRAELATRVEDPPVKELLVTLLNHDNERVRRVQDSKEAAVIRDRVNKAVMLEDSMAPEPEDQILASTVPDALDLDTDMKDDTGIEKSSAREIKSTSQTKTRSGRVVKQPQNILHQYFQDEEYHNALGVNSRPKKRTRKSKRAKRQYSGSEGDSEGYNDDESYDPEEESEDEDYLHENDDDDDYDDSDEGSEELNDADIFDSLFSTTFQKAKDAFKHMTAYEQEIYDQDELNIRMVLHLDPDYVYTHMDLEEPETLERALILLCQARFGADEPHLRISPHIKYDSFPPNILQAVKKQVALDAKDITEFRSLFSQAPILAKKKKAKRSKKAKAKSFLTPTLKQAKAKQRNDKKQAKLEEAKAKNAALNAQRDIDAADKNNEKMDISDDQQVEDNAEDLLFGEVDKRMDEELDEEMHDEMHET